MLKAKTRLRVWGNSIGLTLPKREIKQKNMAANDVVMVTVEKVKSPLREAFGKLKFSKSTDDLLKEVDEAFQSKY